MRVIPAIDLKDGQCVRLQKGDYGTAHKVAENPVETAQRFLDAGADLVHMVDLDAAKDGSHANYGVVEQVIRETGATVELGGGIRSMQDVETVLALGVSRVIIGSAAVRDPEFVAEAVKKYGDKIVVGIDAKSETVRTDGWLDDSGENYIAFAERMESIGVRHIIFTDIDKDGMLAGPNFDQLAALRAEALHAAEFDNFDIHVFGEPNFSKLFVAELRHFFAERLQLELLALQLRFRGAQVFVFFVVFGRKGVLTHDGAVSKGKNSDEVRIIRFLM